ncbi:MAG: crossover junction endodeoxyribonuclease RuvC, partial [Anaerolineae bacterium]|nr:crossover junction endodeoxyribonuclease RuvC [Anaerolineae bacterium]
ILAIDPGYERMGIAALERIGGNGGKDALLDSSCFKTSATLPFHERLLLLGEEVGGWIQKWQPEAMAIEKLFFNTNQKTAMQVSEARGVVIYEAMRNGVPVFEYTPLQVKIAIAGHGHAEKGQVTLMVQKLVKVDKKIVNDDEYDAIAIGLTHLASHH